MRVFCKTFLPQPCNLRYKANSQYYAIVLFSKFLEIISDDSFRAIFVLRFILLWKDMIIINVLIFKRKRRYL